MGLNNLELVIILNRERRPHDILFYFIIFNFRVIFDLMLSNDVVDDKARFLRTKLFSIDLKAWW